VIRKDVDRPAYAKLNAELAGLGGRKYDVDWYQPEWSWQDRLRGRGLGRFVAGDCVLGGRVRSYRFATTVTSRTSPLDRGGSPAFHARLAAARWSMSRLGAADYVLAPGAFAEGNRRSYAHSPRRLAEG